MPEEHLNCALRSAVFHADVRQALARRCTYRRTSTPREWITVTRVWRGSYRRAVTRAPYALCRLVQVGIVVDPLPVMGEAVDGLGGCLYGT